MTVMLKRQLTESEKEQILTMHGRRDFATGLQIPSDEEIQFDHIEAFADGGESELNNIAPMSPGTNRQKGTLPLADFRVKLRLDKFFQRGDRLTLGDLLRFMREEKDIKEYGQVVETIEDGDWIDLKSASTAGKHRLYRCPTTQWKYFYATLPVNVIESDDEADHSVGLQPRYLILDKVFEMYRHFRRHPVLQPSIGRIVDQRVKLFDGQHKAAGLLWAGRREFEVKLYVSCDPRLLNTTNISAHDKFAQTRFYSSIMVMKLGSQFGTDFDEYKKDENDVVKSEAGFMEWLERRDSGLAKKADRNEQFRSYLYNSVLQDNKNKLSKYISASNRSTDEKPITIDMLSKSLLTGFMLREPVSDNMATDAYLREAEVENVVDLMNMLHDLALHAWSPQASASDTSQRKLVRMFRSKSIMAWSELLRDAISAKLDLHDADEKAKVFYRNLGESEKAKIKAVVSRLTGWKFWLDAGSEIDEALAGSKTVVKEWFRAHGLTTGYLLGASI